MPLYSHNTAPTLGGGKTGLPTFHPNQPAPPPYHSFTRKQISISFEIFHSSDWIETLVLEEDYRIKATVTHAGMSTGTELDMTIYGMTMNDMNKLSYVGNLPSKGNIHLHTQCLSTVTVRVGDYGTPLTTLFVGQITMGYASYKGGEPSFQLHAMTITLLTDTHHPGLSYNGPHDVIAMVSEICARAGYELINYGGWDRTATLTDTHVEGTTLDQLHKIILDSCKGGYNLTKTSPKVPSIKTPSGNGGKDTKKGKTKGKKEDQKEDKQEDPVKGFLEIWGPSFDGHPADNSTMSLPVISAETGLIDYPEYNPQGAIKFSCLLRPDLAYFHPLEVHSKYSPAGWGNPPDKYGRNSRGQAVDVAPAPWNGKWLPNYIKHDISSEVENGPWLTYVECLRIHPKDDVIV